MSSIIAVSPNKNISIKNHNMITRNKKQQDDRLLKQLSRIERKQQEMLRQMIMKDLSFSIA